MPETTGYADIAEHYRNLINAGTLKAGDRLPPVRAVTGAWNVSNMTAVRAYKVLKAEGLTTSCAGTGTVVADRRRIIAGSRRIQGITQPGETVPYLRSARVQAPEWVAEYLGEGECVNRTRAVNRGGLVLQASQSWIHLSIADVVPEVDEHAPCLPTWQAVYQDRSGNAVEAASNTVRARIATTEDRDAFGLTDDAAVIVLRSVYVSGGVVVGVGEGAYAPGHPLDIA